ncbi:NosD domain-containing protein [Methanospirillum stamsii]|uniref:Periplasmic copper-binding protein NosD beta helix domain-containing protein n=1 Tax=Methanospirillum stamsii TaxID=1277351 RepID=A0A2V2N6B4_9EURY|nr:NosD domain-containing protein [Methanospirillum stamsii]PWR70833.1 hypothetical protein DLD82_15210 [Methanospirillum stamsii]
MMKTPELLKTIIVCVLVTALLIIPAFGDGNITEPSDSGVIDSETSPQQPAGDGDSGVGDDPGTDSQQPEGSGTNEENTPDENTEDEETDNTGDDPGTDSQQPEGSGTNEEDTPDENAGDEDSEGTGEDEGSDGESSEIFETLSPEPPVLMKSMTTSPDTGAPDPLAESGTSDPGAGTGVVTLGTVHITATGTELTPGGGNGYTFTGTYSDGQITITGQGDNAGQYYLREDLHSSANDFAIQIQTSGVTLDGNGFSVIKTGSAGSSGGISLTSEADGTTVKNFDGSNALSDHSGITDFNRGIESYGDNVVITGNKATGNVNAGIYSGGDTVTISDNLVQGTHPNGDGIFVIGSQPNVIGNTVTDNPGASGINTDAISATISGNTLQRNEGGIMSYGEGSTIRDNTISDNIYGGIYLTDSETGVTITGNTVQNNPRGIMFEDQGGSGNGHIYNNYFANTQNVDTSDDPDISAYTWTNPSGPTPGTNIVGGSNIAGNYWSDPTGTGWSDTHARDSRGYTDDPYEIANGVYDNKPLVKTPAPNPNPSPSQNQDTDSATNQNTNNPGSGSSDTPRINVVLTAASVGNPASPGTTTNLILTLENIGTLPLSPSARIILVPVNERAEPIGEQPVEYVDGKFILNYPLLIPTEPGTYTYIFSPVMVTEDPDTGEEVRITVGDKVQFTVVVGEDGTVTVTMG